MFLVNLEGVYGLYHILYIIIVLILMGIGLFLTQKVVKKDKTKLLIVKISGIVLLIMILLNRITVTYYDVVINHREGYSFLNLIPGTFCGMASLITSLTIVFGKKDHLVLHFISYLGFFGGLITIFYPDFLESQTFFDIRSITGLIHHALLVWLFLVTMQTKYFVPSIKKWFVFPIGFAIMMCIGAFEYDALKFDSAMQINKPLLSSLPVLTSWYVVGLAEAMGTIVLIILYEIIVNKKTLKNIFKNN